ncbi:hypothetical protein HER17_11645 [Pectobacterium carotovorum]|nr:hypothetical protein EH203_11865 [Pectobacterium carotovorum subsp. carotovorum]QLL93562.1 hypothetical protein HER17_11645 [Pectobacterium carotovorum]
MLIRVAYTSGCWRKIMLEAVLYGVFTLAVIFALEYHDVHNEIAHQISTAQHKY